MLMEFYLSKELVYAMLGSGATIAGSYSLGILKKLADKLVIDKIRTVFDKDTSVLQKRLFGFGDDLLAIRGTTKWKLRGNDEIIWGDQIPVYDWIGLSNLADVTKGIDCIKAKSDDRILNGEFNLLSMGGSSINPVVNQIQNDHIDFLPYQFCDISEVPEEFRPLSKIKVPRVWKDPENGDIYYKPKSENSRYLIDVKDKKKPPIGPFYDEKGYITRDVFLITILPTKNGKKSVLVTPGHGSGCKLADIFCSYSDLTSIAKDIKKQPHSYLQALFLVPVTMNDEEEIYGAPELWDVQGLKI